MYNDEVIIKTMTAIGYTLSDARNYVAIGSVEPTSQGGRLTAGKDVTFRSPRR
jgi:formate C-acetyltransferase